VFWRIECWSKSEHGSSNAGNICAVSSRAAQVWKERVSDDNPGGPDEDETREHALSPRGLASVVYHGFFKDSCIDANTWPRITPSLQEPSKDGP